ncbi:hypothetical protein P9112_001638 [Eukaryota sp. TZLM1-RC]
MESFSFIHPPVYDHKKNFGQKLVSPVFLGLVFTFVIAAVVILTMWYNRDIPYHSPGPNPDLNPIMWVAGDIHVGFFSEPYEGYHFKQFVEDLESLNMGNSVVFLGDLMEDDLSFVPPFNNIANRLLLNWTYVLGNHDFHKSTNEPLFPPRYFAQTVHGIRFIFISDESGLSRNLVMTTAQQEWFFDELRASIDQPVFIFSHQPYYEVEMWKELRAQLDSFSITAWFSAHKHNWDIKPDTGFGFPNIGLHSIGGIRAAYSSSFLSMSRSEDMVDVQVCFRNHYRQQWIKVDKLDDFQFSVSLNASREN